MKIAARPCAVVAAHQGGQVKALAVTGRDRAPRCRRLPTVAKKSGFPGSRSRNGRAARPRSAPGGDRAPAPEQCAHGTRRSRASGLRSQANSTSASRMNAPGGERKPPLAGAVHGGGESRLNNLRLTSDQQRATATVRGPPGAHAALDMLAREGTRFPLITPTWSPPCAPDPHRLLPARTAFR